MNIAKGNIGQTNTIFMYSNQIVFNGLSRIQFQVRPDNMQEFEQNKTWRCKSNFAKTTKKIWLSDFCSHTDHALGFFIKDRRAAKPSRDFFGRQLNQLAAVLL